MLRDLGEGWSHLGDSEALAESGLWCQPAAADFKLEK